MGGKRIKGITKEKLQKMHFEKDMTQPEIAEIFGCSTRTIKSRFKEYGLKGRLDLNDTGPKTKEGLEKVTKNLTDIQELHDKGVWQLSEEGREAKAIAAHLNNMKNGLYASIPIRCKADGCPYKDSCQLFQMDKAPEGELCPIEISTIEQLAERYMEELDVDPNDMIDISMIRDVIDSDISIMRCNKKLATDADVVQQVIAGVSEDGNAFFRPEVHKAYDLQMKLIKQRRKLLQDLHATRKEKAKNDEGENFDPSVYIANLKKKAEKFKDEDDVIDVSEEIEDEIDIDNIDYAK